MRYGFHIKTIQKAEGAKMVTTIRLPDELHKNLKAEAEKKGMPLNSFLVALLWEKYTNHQEEGSQKAR